MQSLYPTEWEAGQCGPFSASALEAHNLRERIHPINGCSTVGGAASLFIPNPFYENKTLSLIIFDKTKRIEETISNPRTNYPRQDTAATTRT
jgi:hypothetical protein